MLRYLPMMTKPERYRLSFTFGGLLVPETRVIAEAYHRLGDWNAVRESVVTGNALDKTRASSSQRYFREIRTRLSAAYDWELSVLGDPGSNTGPESTTVLLAIVTRYYRLIGDVVTQVLRRRLLDGIPVIDAALVRAFLGDQIPAHPELEEITQSTREKLVTVMMRIFREAGITNASTRELEVQRPYLSPALRDQYCRQGTTEDLAHLLWTDQEINRCIR
jgi:hypothetical protein